MAVAQVALDVPALQLRELSRTWRVTTSPSGRPIATTQSARPGPRMSMVPVGSRCCRPQAPGEGAGVRCAELPAGCFRLDRGFPRWRGRLGEGSRCPLRPSGTLSAQGRGLHGSSTIVLAQSRFRMLQRGRRCVQWRPTWGLRPGPDSETFRSPPLDDDESELALGQGDGQP